MEFSFQIPTKIIFGAGKAELVREYVRGERVLLIGDATLARIGVVDEIKGSLQGKTVVAFNEVEPNPSCDMVDKAAGVAGEFGAECVIGLGGGSTIDTAKAVACLMDKEGKMADYFYNHRVFTGRNTQLIVIPTTAGTGSEVTSVGVFNDTAKHVKKPLVSPWFWADMAIVDPALTYSLPRRVTAITGFDALCHAIESYWNKSSQPFSDVLAVYAVDLILKNLKKAYQEGSDREAREKMALGSLVAGAAFSQTRTTAMHAVSYPLSDHYGIDHGSACALTLVPFMRFCYPAVKDKMDSLAVCAGYKGINELLGYIADLLVYTGMPVKLSQVNIEKADIEKIADESLNSNLINLAPRKITKEDLVKLLSDIY